MTYALPPAKAVKDLFEDLLARDVNVSSDMPIRAHELIKTVTSVYVDNTLRMVAVVGMDLGLAAYAGAALGLVPVGGARACLEDRALTPMLAENVAEICNVLASLLNRDGVPHVRLYQTFMPGDIVPADAAGQLVAIGRRVDFELAVSGYGKGRFSMVLTA